VERKYILTLPSPKERVKYKQPPHLALSEREG
jgi:hypothetical protein